MTTTFLAPRASTKDAGDTASVNSDWVPWMEERDDHTVHEYLEALDDIRGTEFWFPEQEKLHQLCWLRGHHPVLQKSWEFHFLMYRLPQTLYTPKGSKKRVAISSKTCDFRGTSTKGRKGGGEGGKGRRGSVPAAGVAFALRTA